MTTTQPRLRLATNCGRRLPDDFESTSASGSTLPMVDQSVARVDVRADIEPKDGPPHRGFTQDDPLRRDSAAVQPHGHLGLSNALPGQLGELLGKSCLSARDVNDSLNGEREATVEIGLDRRHTRSRFNTESVIAVNTRSVLATGHTGRMPRTGETSAFWERLTQARTTCSPPKSMKQTDVARDYNVRQSAVTKWKTGKGLPDPSLIKDMAVATNVNVNWLWAGQGDMRPLPATDPITRRILEAVNTLDDDSRLTVLRAAIVQQAATENPSVAARLREAQEAIKEVTVRAKRRAIR